MKIRIKRTPLLLSILNKEKNEEAELNFKVHRCIR